MEFKYIYSSTVLSYLHITPVFPFSATLNFYSTTFRMANIVLIAHYMYLTTLFTNDFSDYMLHQGKLFP